MKLIANHAQTYYLIIIVCSGSFFLCVNSTVPTTVCIHMILTNNITHSQSACLFGLWSYTLQCIWCIRYKYRMESVYCWRYRVSRFTFFFLTVHKRAAKWNGRKHKIQLHLFWFTLFTFIWFYFIFSRRFFSLSGFMFALCYAIWFCLFKKKQTN